jgi:hypothetical protein
MTIEQERSGDSGFVQDFVLSNGQNRCISFSGEENVSSGCEFPRAFNSSGGYDAFQFSLRRNGARFKPVSAYQACLKGNPQTPQTRYSHPGNDE